MRIIVEFEACDFEPIQESADLSGMTISEYVRSCVLNAPGKTRGLGIRRWKRFSLGAIVQDRNGGQFELSDRHEFPGGRIGWKLTPLYFRGAYPKDAAETASVEQLRLHFRRVG